MRSKCVAVVIGAAVMMPVCAVAQLASPPREGAGTLELRRQGPPIVAPAPQSPEAIREAQRDLEELEQRQRQAEQLREAIPSPPRRPDLDYDVKSGIQQKALTPR